MIEKLKNWLKSFSSAEPAPPSGARKKSYNQGLRPPSVKQDVPEFTPEFDDDDDGQSSEIESLGPGKNVLVRNKYVREETGTHEKLKIIDDSIIDSGEEAGLDPYNTGSFDRSKKWDQRFRK